MNQNYISDNIFIKDNKLYEQHSNKDILINKNNWHKILSELGWEKLPLPWIKILNKYNDNKYKNSQFGVLDCGSDGDCFFHCIAYALNTFEINKKEPIIYNAQDLRQLLANSISKEIFNEIISIYKILKDSNDLDEMWDPYNITDKEYRNMITNNCNIFWCDHILLSLIIKILNINIIILNSNEYTKQYNLYKTMTDYNSYNNTIILLYENSNHFKLIGHFKDNNMISLFNNRNIPSEIYKLIMS